MNFSIVVPGSCNAKCGFCFWEDKEVCSEYMKKLEYTILNLPNGLTLSLTGGEPTISGFLIPILELLNKYKKKFERIVLTTNGTNLINMTEYIGGIVDHVNISRHHIDDDINYEVFGVQTIKTSHVKLSSHILNLMGIDVTLNCVITDKLPCKRETVHDFIKYAKDVYASAICFRKDNGTNSLDETDLEGLFSNYDSKYEYSCPVCRTKVQFIDGMKVSWKAGTQEPSRDLNDIYELIFQVDGRLTTDWEGKDEVAASGGILYKSYHPKMKERPEFPKICNNGDKEDMINSLREQIASDDVYIIDKRYENTNSCGHAIKYGNPEGCKGAYKIVDDDDTSYSRGCGGGC